MNKYNFNLGGGASRSLKAFTLAEVLITLAIIGVVAALTIPSVVSHSRRTEIESKLKKSYMVLSQAVNLAIKDYGPVSGWNFPDGSNPQDIRQFANTYFAPYLKIARDCTKSNHPDCNYSGKNLSGYKLLHNNSDGTYASYYLADGSYIEFKFNVDKVQFFVDCNGNKKPNVLGYDLFTVSIRQQPNDIIKYPLSVGYINEKTFSGNTSCATGGNGAYCLTLIVSNGWKIPSKDEYVRMGGDITKYPYNGLY